MDLDVLVTCTVVLPSHIYYAAIRAEQYYYDS